VERVRNLVVVARCECDCARVEFAKSSEMSRSRVLADALAKTSGGNRVGVLVWGTEEVLTGLEIYTMSAPDDGSLPLTGSVMPWDKGASAD